MMEYIITGWSTIPMDNMDKRGKEYNKGIKGKKL